jgi:hypothetical protein
LTSSFLALYRGETVSSAKLVAVSADPRLVRGFASSLLDAHEERDLDPVLEELEDGRRRALHLVRDEHGE